MRQTCGFSHVRRAWNESKARAALFPEAEQTKESAWPARLFAKLKEKPTERLSF
jgi:hypothetical protein